MIIILLKPLLEHFRRYTKVLFRVKMHAYKLLKM